MILPFGTPGALKAVPPTAGHLGQGIAYPLRFTSAGRLGLSSGQQSVEDALRGMIETAQGERVMLTEYGAADFLFEPIDLDRGIASLTSLIAVHEPRIASVEVTAAPDPAGQGIADLSVVYTVAQQASAAEQTFNYFAGPPVT